MFESTTESAARLRVPVGGGIVARCDVPPDYSDRMKMANMLGSDEARGMLPEHLRGNPAAVFGTMLHAQALDIPLWLALQHTYVIEGSWGQDTALTHALVLRAGHKVEIVAESAQVCTVRIRRWDEPDRDDLLASFTMQEASLAGLLERKNWRKYPKDMLYARALGRAARRWCRDVVMGFAYTRDELTDDARRDPGEPTMVVADPQRAQAAAALAAQALSDEVTTQAQVEALAAQAEGKGLMSQLDSSGVPLRQLLHDRWRQLAPEPAAEGSAAAEEAAAQVPDAGQLPCGCRKLEVVANGGHRTGCAQRRAPRVIAEETPDDAWERERQGWVSEYGEDIDL